jgi:hypothetical protein
MRKAQNVMKFGLKLGAFAALAASLSSCLIVVDPGPPTIAFVTAPVNYCFGDGIARTTTLNFTFDVSNIDGADVEAVVTADALSDVADPTTIPQGGKTSTNVTNVVNLNKLGTGRYSSSVTLKMDANNQFLSLSSLGPKITVTTSDVRLWVRAFNKSTQTNWAKSPAITQKTCP